MANKVKGGKKKGVKKVKVTAKSKRASSGSKANMTSGMNIMGLSHAVCSVTNPFCPEAHGAKWPDGQFTRSATWDIDGMPVSFPATNASGEYAALYFAGMKAQFNYHVGITTGTISYAATNTVAVAAPSNISRYRLTSWGLRLTSELSSMSAAGVVRIRLFSPLTGASLASSSISSTSADESYDIPISRLVGRDYHILPKPLGLDARTFRDYTNETTTMASWVNPGWQVIQVAVQGAPASTAGVITAYLYYHFEVLFTDGDASNAFAHAPPPNNVVVKEVATGVLSRVGNFFEGAAEKVDSLMKSKAVKLLTSGIATAYGGPQAGQATYSIMDGHQGGSHRYLGNID
jgi:hypothetical protein